MMKPKKYALISLSLAAAMLFGGCRGMDKKGEESSLPSSEASSPAASSAPESQPAVNPPLENLPNQEPSSEDEVSSEEEAPANAVPEQIPVDGVELPDLSQYDASAVKWGPGHEMDEENRSTACVKLQEKYGDKGAYFLMPNDEKKIYLTFDEGYENGYTEKILDTLKDKGCPAVFFVTYDYVTRNPELVQRMVDEGHTVGNHTMHHPNMAEIDSETAVREIAELHNYVAEHFNYQMTLFRPPRGLFSERSLILTKSLGYKTILWSFGYYDYKDDDQPDPAKALPKIVGAAHNGALYLLHAVSSTNAQILPEFIDTLRGEGYTFEMLR